MAVTTGIEKFGEWEGRVINKYTIAQAGGICLSVINYGATVTHLFVPDKNNVAADIVLGFDSLNGYIDAGRYYFGAICGRYANRIHHGAFSLDGHNYHLSKNSNGNCLHGGYQGFDKKYWEAELLPAGDGVKFMYKSFDGEEGFPGNLDAAVTYRISGHALHIAYEALSDKATPINLTNHCYFNLSGGADPGILNHQLQIASDEIVEVDEQLIPTGKIIPVANTSTDFRALRRIGKGDTPENFDYSFVLRGEKGQLREAATLIHEASGRSMKVLTTQPAVHFYSGFFLDGNMVDTKGRHHYGSCAGLCLETQHYPDSPNHFNFPTTILRPGEKYSEQSIFLFGE